ncbi:exodeoxyribonuclease VII small subunit [Roseiconus lacunae]|uniref:Exodeoxyribonuclease 7 small subunit n=1 Tax=Roseiconus lacunae TaxID=2605694 RepID=A0ABT7PBY3_9BACT|nr:exodeoxyribonuclease VII small subunit [Roseiconus lacunae]MDM4014000.1 exodeoxyribonuclease VII small subunit [Roseiconus lacunae]
MAKKKQSPSSNASSNPNDIDFESSLQEVEAIVEQLESGELGLSESLASYEKGIAKIKLCHEVLRRAEQKISLLTQVDEDGTPHVEPVEGSPSEGSRRHSDEEAETQTRPRAKRKKRESDNVDDLGGLF